MARSRAVSQAFHVLVADYLFHPHGSLGMPYFERGALHDVVLVLEPREEAREYALDVVCHDLADPRIFPRQAIRDQFNQYMRTVMREEPIDPTIEILPDEHAW